MVVEHCQQQETPQQSQAWSKRNPCCITAYIAMPCFAQHLICVSLLAGMPAWARETEHCFS